MAAVSGETNCSSEIECGLFKRFDYISGANHPIFENVRPEATSMRERLQYAVLRELLKMSARFTQAIASTDGVTDAESLSDEMVECDISGFDVS